MRNRPYDYPNPEFFAMRTARQQRRLTYVSGRPCLKRHPIVDGQLGKPHGDRRLVLDGSCLNCRQQFHTRIRDTEVLNVMSEIANARRLGVADDSL